MGMSHQVLYTLLPAVQIKNPRTYSADARLGFSSRTSSPSIGP